MEQGPNITAQSSSLKRKTTTTINKNNVHENNNDDLRFPDVAREYENQKGKRDSCHSDGEGFRNARIRFWNNVLVLWMQRRMV